MIRRKTSNDSDRIKRNFAKAAVVLAAGICTACGATTRDSGDVNSQGGNAGAAMVASGGRNSSGGGSAVGGSNGLGGSAGTGSELSGGNAGEAGGGGQETGGSDVTGGSAGHETGGTSSGGSSGQGFGGSTAGTGGDTGQAGGGGQETGGSAGQGSGGQGNAGETGSGGQETGGSAGQGSGGSTGGNGTGGQGGGSAGQTGTGGFAGTGNSGGNAGYSGSGGMAGAGGAIVCDDQSICVTTPAEVIMDRSYGLYYVENQNAWTTSSLPFSDLASAMDFESYSAVFDGNGIPVCGWDGENGDYTLCKTGIINKNSATDRHRVSISFLGETWTITNMTAATGTLTNETDTVNGGSIMLGRESNGGLLYVDDALIVDNLRFRFDGHYANGTELDATISVVDSGNNVLETVNIGPGTTHEFDVSGSPYLVHIYSTGTNFGEAYAETSVLMSEVHLVDGLQFNGFEVAVEWSNRNTTTTDNPDHLKAFHLYRPGCDYLVGRACE